MSKYYHIRWSESDNLALSRAVKNFNSKISRLAKKHPEMKNALPDKVSVKQMKELIDTRQDLKRELNALRRFSRRGAEELVTLPNNEYNIQVTRWQKNEMSRRVAIINRKRKKRLEQIQQIEKKSRGESLGYTVGQVGMGKVDENAMKPMKAFTPKMTRTEANKKFRTIMKESQSNYWDVKQSIMKENYKRAIEENFNPKDVVDVIKEIDTMTFEEFYEKIMSEDTDWEFPYPPDEEQYQQYLSVLRGMFTPEEVDAIDKKARLTNRIAYSEGVGMVDYQTAEVVYDGKLVYDKKKGHFIDSSTKKTVLVYREGIGYINTITGEVIIE